ncbi:MAG: cadmium-translocating P-type ATPase [Lachnospiraceae bacterium]|nr:cadmium-translocating P-type ATPase [Lachnospiraceae bacterium]
MNKKQKKNLIRIIVSAALMIILHFVPVEGLIKLVLYMIPYLIIGYDILIKAGKGIINKQPFDECLLMAIATIGAIILGIIGSGDYVEAVAVMLFYQIGEWFQSYAVGKSRKNITDLMDIRPDYANIDDGNGSLEKVDPDDVEVGTVITVKPGEKIPIDGIIEEGTSTLNTAALTGESLPRDVVKGDEVISGCVNINGVLRIRTTKEFDESTASKILELIEEASTRKSRSEDFITRFARIYTPAVVFSALALAIIPPIAIMLISGNITFGTWIYRALIFLVISCPCALVISIPLSFFAGIGSASSHGILVKGSSFLELLSQTKTIVFDKTGTLTRGTFEVTAIHPQKIDAKHLLHMAAHVERYSSHPIAMSLKEAYKDENDGCSVENVEEIPGRGIKATVNGHALAVGNEKMMADLDITPKKCHKVGTTLHVVMDNEYVGHIVISDVIKEHSKEAIAALKANGVERAVMLTGDSEEVAKDVAETLGLDEYHAGLLPGDKVERVEKLFKEKTGEDAKIAFVGDGINDAPVLTRADIGIAMGGMGSDAAIEAADVVLMDDDPLKIATALKISRKCLRIVKENIWFAIGVKLICLLLGAVGIANMWVAIFADVGVMVIAVLNAIRCLHVSKR